MTASFYFWENISIYVLERLDYKNVSKTEQTPQIKKNSEHTIQKNYPMVLVHEIGDKNQLQTISR